MKILVVEDDRMNRVELKAILVRMEHDVILAGNGEEGVALFVQEQPDMVLMDVVMPVMSGYEAARLIKRHSAGSGQFVPIIFLTSLTDDTELARCVEFGGDDFLSKPYNYTLIKAKIDAFDRIHVLYAVLARQKRELESHQANIAHELSLARHVFGAVVSRQPKNIDHLNQWIYPVGHFSGDLIIYERSPGGQLYVMLGDFTGHGLAAALGAIPASDIFFSMTRQGFGLDDIAAEINKKLRYFLPTGNFCAACLISIDGLRRRVEIWNGGLPPVLVLDSEGCVTRKVASSKVPLGVVDSEQFDREMEVIPLHEVASVLLYSDGLIEATNSRGQQFGMAGLAQAVASVKKGVTVLDGVKAAVNRFMGERSAHDDISLLELKCGNIAVELVEGFKAPKTAELATSWFIELGMKSDALRDIDPLPILMNWLMQSKLPERQKTHVYTVLNELVSNAVEHGLLGLESASKSTPEGFENYYEKRKKLLSEMERGQLSIRVEQIPVFGGRVIKMRVEDSGNGFNVDDAYSALANNEEKYGRGIALARSMCSRLVYTGNGNTVEAEYRG